MKRIKKLQDKGILIKEGSAKTCNWRVLENNI